MPSTEGSVSRHYWARQSRVLVKGLPTISGWMIATDPMFSPPARASLARQSTRQSRAPSLRTWRPAMSVPWYGSSRDVST